ncbi:MAG: Crp/Fnr family transcriptional regulator [Deltaproteobacteria bacterium]|nr:Crp/Fnr family transcriptional regulator [Deltaproteobacteria bacterium]
MVKKRVVAQLGKGQLLGEYTFTSISLCSAMAVTHTEVTLYYLEYSAIKTWEDKAPGLYEKLESFCLKYGHIKDISQRKKLFLESKPRSPASGRVVGYFLNKEGRKTEDFLRGELQDISRDGCCVGIKLSNKAMAKALLTRQLIMTFFAPGSGEQAAFQAAGKIVKISFHIHNDYSIHLKFAESLAADQLNRVVRKG